MLEVDRSELLTSMLLCCRTRAKAWLLPRTALAATVHLQCPLQHGPAGVLLLSAGLRKAHACVTHPFRIKDLVTGTDCRCVCRGVISFQHVRVQYTPGGQAALNNLELHVEAGEKLGICGRTGTLTHFRNNSRVA